MFCSSGDFLTCGYERLHQRYGHVGGNADCRLGQGAATNDDPLRSGMGRLRADADKRGVKRGRVRHQRLWVSVCQKAPQIAGPLGAHQRVDGRGKLGRSCHDGKRRAVLPSRPRGCGSYANHGTVQPLCQGVSTGIPKGCNDHRSGWWQICVSNGPRSLRQGLGIGDHVRRGGVCPTLHIWQVLPDDTQHRLGRLLRTVRIDQQNRFHQMGYPA